MRDCASSKVQKNAPVVKNTSDGSGLGSPFCNAEL